MAEKFVGKWAVQGNVHVEKTVDVRAEQLDEEKGRMRGKQEAVKKDDSSTTHRDEQHQK